MEKRTQSNFTITAQLRLLQLHNRMKSIIGRIVNNDHRNRLVKIEKYHYSISEHLKDKVGFQTMDKGTSDNNKTVNLVKVF